MKDFFSVLKLLKNYKKYAVLNIVFNVLAIFFSLFSMVLLIPVLEIIFSDENKVQEILSQPVVTDFWAEGYSIKDHGFYYMAQQIESAGAPSVLFYVCVIIVVAILLKNLSTYLALFFIAVFRNGIIRDFRNQMYSHILQLPLSFYSEEKKGDILSRATNDLKEIEWSTLRSIEAIFRDPISILAHFAVLIWMSPQLTVFLVLFFPVAGLIIGYIGKSLRRSAQKGQNQLGGLMALFEETLGGLRIIKGFNAKEKMQDRFEDQNENFNRTMVRMNRKGDLASPMSEVLGVVLIVTVVMYGGGLVFSGELEGSFFLGYVILLSQLLSPFKSITNAYSNAQRGLSALTRVREILDAPVPIKDPEQPVEFSDLQQDVRFNDVSFKYQTDWVLRNINFTIPKGKTVALVGQSGSGKSTIADLLPRFYEVVEGSIEMDGIDIRNLRLYDLRAQLGIVTQQSILFNDTVLNNIAFGVDHVTKEDVIEAAKIANAHEFITALENGYDTNIGDGGGKLSGGQKQRLSIARAVLKNPPVLILDEATSALDTESERLVQDALNNLMRNRTSLVIAHRLSTIQHADEIIVLNEGQIVERGTHSELIALNGNYKKLIDMQSFV